MCRYLSISSERQQPKRQMMSVSTAAQKRPMAPEEQRERMDVSVADMLQAVLKAQSAEQRCLVSREAVIGCQVLGGNRSK